MSKKRPKYSDDETLDHAVEKLIPLVLAWLGDGSTAEHIRGDLRDAIDHHDDGYEICSNLERWHGWAVSAELVEIMDATAHYMFTALNEREKEWVAAEGIKPKYSVGDTVEFPHEDEIWSGEISRVETDVGKYVVYCPQLGHVGAGVGTHGIYIDFEEIAGRSALEGERG